MQTYSELVDGVTTMGELYTRINSNFQVLISNFSGTSFPNPQGPGHPCFRTDRGAAGVMYVYTSDTSQGENGWLDIVAASPALMALDEEVEAARGAASSLAARLAVIMNPDGTLLGDAPVGDWWENVPDFTYVGESSFACAGDVAHLFEDGMGLQITLADDTYTYTRVSGAVTYSDFAKLTTVAVADAVLTADMTKVERGQKTSNAPLVSYDRAEVDAKIDAVCKPRFTVTSQDWDTLVNPGVYKVAGATGDNAASTESASGVLVVSAYSQTGYVWQEYVGAATVRRWSRWWNGRIWFPWAEQVMDPSTVARIDGVNVFSTYQQIANDKALYFANVAGDGNAGSLSANVVDNFILDAKGAGGLYLQRSGVKGVLVNTANNVSLYDNNVERLKTTTTGVQLPQANDVLHMRAGRLEYMLSDLPNLSAMGDIEWVTCNDNVSGYYCRVIRHSGLGHFTCGNVSQGYPCHGVALLTAAITAGQVIPVLTKGYARSDEWSWNPGYPIYCGSSGKLTQTPTSVSGYYVQQIGVAEESNVLRIDPDKTVIKLK